MFNYYVYILTNKYNKVLYIGVTNNLSRRIYEHKNGLNNGYTKAYNADKLVYAEKYEDIDTAIKREKQLKGWLRKRKIELISQANPEWNEIEPF